MSPIYSLLLNKINQNHNLIEEWFKDKFSKSKPLFYNSADLRHSSFKIAPIDTNCFPAGFNNLSTESKKLAKKVIKDFLITDHKDAKKILLIPENHTRNLHYLENISALVDILSNNGEREVAIGSLIADIEDQLTLKIDDNRSITLHKIVKENNKIITKSGFEPDLIISNNDFTHLPELILQNISQPIIPPSSIGWYFRTKSNHFNIYNLLADEFSKIIDIDPWLISTMHHECGNISFKSRTGIDCLAKAVDDLIEQIQQKYQQYNIKHDPYCYIKADSGTYGIAIMTAKSGEDIVKINKKERNKMSMLKGNVQNTKVIIQEGVITSDKVQNNTAEPLIYLINGQVISNLFRINSQRDANISLNATGMTFDDLNNLSDQEVILGSPKEDVVKIYSIIARLATLAAANESY